MIRGVHIRIVLLGKCVGVSEEQRDKAETFCTQRVWSVNNDLLLLARVCLEESLVVVSGLRHHAVMGRVTHHTYTTNTCTATPHITPPHTYQNCDTQPVCSP